MYVVCIRRRNARRRQAIGLRDNSAPGPGLEQARLIAQTAGLHEMHSCRHGLIGWDLVVQVQDIHHT